ncbi:MAG: PAS domain S-box protein [Sulfuricella sp.]|nr:PAS domain S-box protein [Sulfuricella sp.]
MIHRRFIAIAAALLTASGILTLVFSLDRLEQENRYQMRRAEALNQLSLVRARLESSLNSRLFLGRGLIAFVIHDPEFTQEDFQHFAATLLRQQPGVRSIQLARDSVVSHIYPLAGNQVLLGTRLLDHPLLKSAAQRAIDTRITVVAGPFEMVAVGGVAIVSRTPIYRDDGRYWGLASIVIDQETFIREAGLDQNNPIYQFALRGKDGSGAEGPVFWGEEQVFAPDSVFLDVTLPGGSWQVAATRKDGWQTPGGRWLREGGILLALVAGLLVWLFAKPSRLREEIATRQSVEKNLREQRDLYQGLLKAQSDIGEGLFIIDNRRIVYSNEALHHITGYDDQELCNMSSFIELTHPDYRDKVMERHLRRVAGEQFENRYEIAIVTKGGENREVEIAVAMIPGSNDRSVVVVMQDISARKKIESALKEQVHFVQTLIDAIPNPVFFKDTTGRYLGCNKAFETSLGKPAAEIIGKLVYDLSPGDLAATYHQKDLELLGRGGLQAYEAEVLFDDDIRHDILFYKSVFSDAQGQTAGLVGVMLDITARKLAEEELRVARDELEIRVIERTRALAEKNLELNAEISERRRLEKEIIHVSEEEQKRIGQELHDGLGQHLTGIAFLCKVLEQKLGAKALDEKTDAEEIVQLVNQAVAKTRLLARGLFPVELEANGLMAALEQLAANTQRLYGVECVFRCDEPVLVHDNVVAINLYRIAQEAVNNAVKHSRAGQIFIELANVGAQPLLTIADNGIGLDSDGTKNDNGMGMHIMHYRAKMIGAALEIRKNASQGTTLSVLGQ